MKHILNDFTRLSRIGIIICAGFILHLNLSAQSQSLRLGVSLNPHLNWFTENSGMMKTGRVKTGFEGGLVLENYFAKNYAFATGVRIGNYGGRIVYTDSITLTTDEDVKTIGASTEVNYKLQYITLPVGLKLKTNQIGFLTYYAAIGFTPQLNIRARANAPGVLDNAGIDKEIGLFNLSYHFGGGIEYGIGGNTALILGIVYHNGFIDVLSKQGGKESLNTLTIQLGVMF